MLTRLRASPYASRPCVEEDEILASRSPPRCRTRGELPRRPAAVLRPASPEPVRSSSVPRHQGQHGLLSESEVGAQRQCCAARSFSTRLPILVRVTAHQYGRTLPPEHDDARRSLGVLPRELDATNPPHPRRGGFGSASGGTNAHARNCRGMAGARSCYTEAKRFDPDVDSNATSETF
jgi:hypothetical protein